ncbi:unnamed protein product, partial [Tetraodon nigroviridis]
VIGRKLPEPEVKIEVLHKPLACYRKSKYGDMLLVHYDGFLESNGTLFHSSRKDGDQNPVWFTLGIQEAMKGWDQGLQNMCTGERRKLTIPPALAYGKEGKGKIPPWQYSDFLTPLRRWISTMTGSCPKKRCQCFFSISYAVISFIVLHVSPILYAFNVYY